MTRHKDLQDPAALQEAGFDRRLVKPLKIGSLQRELLTLFGADSRSSFSPAVASADDRQALPADEIQWKGRVLLVEDNKINQKLALRLLEKAGVEADCVDNGLAGLEMVQTRPYALVLMDCQMPVMDGYEATRRIRALGDGYARLPIIAMTAHAMIGDRERCLAAGMNDYLGKPITAAQFRGLLRTWLAAEPTLGSR